MEISHVIRGEEWLPSLPLHVMLYEAFGWEPPLFAHLPLILKPEGKGKLSKRDGDKMGFPVFPIQYNAPNGETYRGYREDGYLPDAFINMLALLGWNPGDEREIMSLDELTEAFSIDRVGKSGSRFNPDKAKWFNQQYMRLQKNEELWNAFKVILNEKGITEANPKMGMEVIEMVKERCIFVTDFWDQAYFFFETPSEYNASVVKKRWKEQTPEQIKAIQTIFEESQTWEEKGLHDEVAAYIEKNELGFGAIMNALRLVIVGDSKGPDLFKIIELIGKEESLKRIKLALEKIV